MLETTLRGNNVRKDTFKAEIESIGGVQPPQYLIVAVRAMLAVGDRASAVQLVQSMYSTSMSEADATEFVNMVDSMRGNKI